MLTGAGCSGSPRESTARSSEQLPAFDVNPVPRDRVAEGGTLRWPLPEFPSQWNFNHVNGTTGAVERVVQGVLPHLMRADEKAVPRPVPEYLRSATLRRTGRGQVVTYRGTRTAQLYPRSWVEVPVSAERVDEVVEALVAAVRRGRESDGKVWVT